MIYGLLLLVVVQGQVSIMILLIRIIINLIVNFITLLVPSRDLETEEQLLQLAKLAKSAGGENRGTCSKCNQTGHLSFQCRNIQSKPLVNNDDFSSSTSSDSDDYDNKITRKRERSKSQERDDEARDKSKKHKKEKHKKEKHKKEKHKKEKHKKEKHKKEKKDH